MDGPAKRSRDEAEAGAGPSQVARASIDLTGGAGAGAEPSLVPAHGPREALRSEPLQTAAASANPSDYLGMGAGPLSMPIRGARTGAEAGEPHNFRLGIKTQFHLSLKSPNPHGKTFDAFKTLLIESHNQEIKNKPHYASIDRRQIRLKSLENIAQGYRFILKPTAKRASKPPREYLLSSVIFWKI
jgi:hypothetical protein